MISNLLLALVTMLGFGAPVVVLWSLTDGATASWSRWRPWIGWLLAAFLPLAIVAGFALLTQMPDAAIAAGLLPLSHSVPGKLLLLLLPAVLAALILLGAGGPQVQASALRLVGGLGLPLVMDAAWFLERLREGGGPSSSGWRWCLLVGCRALAILAASEVLSPRRPIWTFFAGLAVIPSFLVMPEALREALAPIAADTALAATAALLAARWLPARLRRPAVALGALLLGVLWLEAARVSSSFAALPIAQ